MINRRHLLAIIIIGLVALGIIVTIISFALRSQSASSANNTAYTPPQSSSGNDTAPSATDIVTLKNQSDYQNQLQNEDISSLESGIFAAVARNTPEPAASYSGTIRDGSFVATTVGDGHPKKVFIVDIADVKQSYRIEIEGDGTTDFHTVYVRCPSATELKYGAFSCQDDAQ